SPGPASDHGSRACSPLFDSGLHLNGNPTSTAPSSPSSPVANEPKYEKRWLDTLSVPLSMARISRYKAGAEKLRSSAFKVLALDGVSTGILQFHTAQESADWLRAVSANISDLTRQRVRTENKCSSPCDQVVHMGWVTPPLEGTGSCHTFRSKFLALTPPPLHVFSTPPVSMLDPPPAEKTYNLCEVLFKLHKFWLAEDCWLHVDLGLGPHSLEDTWPYCFSVLVGHGPPPLFSVELGSELAAWERSFPPPPSMEVQRTGSRTYACSWQGETLCFTVDFALGFTCFDSKTKNVLWRFKFSQLKGSSDDGNTRVKLLFQHLDTKQIEVKELEFPDLTAVLHCIHAFLAAKVASVDPTFMDRQSIARKRRTVVLDHILMSHGFEDRKHGTVRRQFRRTACLAEGSPAPTGPGSPERVLCAVPRMVGGEGHLCVNPGSLERLRDHKPVGKEETEYDLSAPAGGLQGLQCDGPSSCEGRTLRADKLRALA
ncbi:PREDICTED: gamma-2-syntrophin, partial [Odobenus rosmarus divergens]|uniref:Gamma-2-syntrophin n=1 Tax=Odobenus rosmarus divergens TaxID=9708 RepID=A0A2U3W9Q1_ODORO